MGTRRAVFRLLAAAAWFGLAGCAGGRPGEGDEGSFGTGVDDGAAADESAATDTTGGSAPDDHDDDAGSSAGPSFDVGAGDTGAMGCDLDEVTDTLAFTYAKTIPTEIPDMVLQASFFDSDRSEITIMSFSGKARRFDLDGNPLTEVFDVPPEALPSLDGATYDPVVGHALLINQGCKLIEVEPETLAVIESKQLDFGMSICAGLALGLDGNLYVTSYGTDELLVISRDGLTEIRRIDMIATLGLDGFDGIALIAGSENFMVMSTWPTADAAIIDGLGNILVPKSPIGMDAAPLISGSPMLPDAILTICGNGHAWVCEAYDGTCFDYAPEDGDKNACACLLPAG